MQPDPNELVSPPLYNQLAEEEPRPVTDDSEALATVTRAYEEAKRYQDGYVNIWRQLWQLWRFYRSADSAVKIFDPIGFAMSVGLLSKIFVQAPKIVLTAKTGGWKWLAKILQAYLEHQFNNPDSDDPMDEQYYSFVTELLVLGTAVGKVCWHTKYITQFEEQATGMDEMGQPIIERVPVEKKAFDDPTFEHIPLDKFFLQPGSKSISESKYAIFEKEVNLSYLEGLRKIVDPMTGQPLYNIPDEALVGSDTAEIDRHGIDLARKPTGVTNTTDEHKDKWQLLEYWEDDKYIVVLNKTWVIRGPEDNPNDDGKKPFIGMPYTRVPHEFYGIGALEPVADLQKAQNITLTQRLQFVSNLLNQQFAVVGTLNASDEDALVEGYPIVHVQSADAIQPLNKGQVPQASFLTAQDILGSMERTMGISGYQLGAPAAADDKTQGTKGGIQSIVSEAQTRFNMTLRRFENIVLKGVAKRFLDLDRQYFSDVEEKMVLVTDQTEQIPVPLTKELLLAAEFHVNIVPGSTGVIEKDQKAQMFMQWAQFAMATIPNFNRELAVIESAEYHDIEMPERFITAMPMMGQGPPGAPGEEAPPPA